MTIEILEKFLTSQGLRSSKSNGSDGLIVGNKETEIKGIAVTWMATRDAIIASASQGLNLVISHEPIFYHPSDNFNELDQDPAFIEKMQEILKNGLLIYRFYSPWIDFPEVGIVDSFVRLLELKNRIGQEPGCRFFSIDENLHTFATRIKAKMCLKEIFVRGDSNTHLHKLAVIVGREIGLPQLRKCLKAGFDCVLTGEASESVLRYAEDSNLSMIMTGHSQIEIPGIQNLAFFLKENFPNEQIEFVNVGNVVHSI